jgi:hypothetical protein
MSELGFSRIRTSTTDYQLYANWMRIEITFRNLPRFDEQTAT